MASVELRGISKSFGEHGILHEVSLDIKDGEFLVLVGPSGCGKSTLLRILAGLEECTRGEVAVDGKVVNELPPRSREIAMVFQDYALYPHMTVEENMSFGLRLRRLPKAEIDARVAEAAAILQLGRLLARMPRQLSGGQRQRVAIGRAIVRKPKAFLFDEPLSNLDAKLREEMRVEIAKLHQKLKATIVYVTHDQVEAMTLAARIAVIHQGRIQQVGTPAELFERPANKFVAGFIGSPTMNFIEGSLEPEGFRGEGVRVPVAHRGTGSPAILGVRPEAVVVEPGSAKNLSEPFQAQVEVSELLGHRKNLYLSVGPHRLLATAAARFGAKPGDSIPVRLDLDSLHLFDKSSEQRIR
jgi:multiple sugar transport system ATP-binding protein